MVDVDVEIAYPSFSFNLSYYKKNPLGKEGFGFGFRWRLELEAEKLMLTVEGRTVREKAKISCLP
jgi:hypothetical protein